MDYMYGEHPLSESDQHFVYHQHEDNWLDELIHRFVGHCRKGILKVNYTVFLGNFYFIAPLTLAMLDHLRLSR
jgi:hypothetical protein